MKYPQLVSSTTPASLQDWLEEELENRGIDGVYTRYILSLLQEDTVDLEPQECEHTPLNNSYYKYADKVEIGEYPLSNSGRSKHQRWKSWGKDKLHGSSNCCCSCGLAIDSEERKKSAAVECLKAASEQKNDLEKLIDEVCAKLKKINSVTGENNEDSECIDIACGELVELLPSSPHEQAEKYYAAFPALTDKLEPLTQLCHQQESECILKNVWDGRKVIECVSGKLNRFVRRNKEDTPCLDKTRDDSLDRESDTSEKENSHVGYLDSKHQNKIKTCKFVETSGKENSTTQESQKPLFIVPKMKTPSQRIPFSVKYLPFNQLRNKKINNVSPKLKSNFSLYDNFSVEEDPEGNLAFNIEDTFDSKENLDDSKNWSVSDLSDMKQHKEIDTEINSYSLFDNLCSNCAKFDVMYAAFSDIFEENDICSDKTELTELTSKFNSKLADIWSDYEKTEAGFDPHNFREDSLNFQDKEAAVLNNESVWTFKKEDFQRVVQKPKSSLTSHYYLDENKDSLIDISLPQSECLSSTQKKSGVDENCLSSNSFISLNNSVNTVKNCSNGNGETSDDNDLANILSDCSKSFNTLTYETITPSPNDSDRESTSQSSLTGAVKGLYSLWKSESSDSSLVFGMDLEKIWEPSPLEEKSNWMGIPLCEEKYSKTLTGLELTDNIMYSSRRNSEDVCDLADSTLSKTKCTLTYHKGESRFVEVVPSRNKDKHETFVLSGANHERVDVECLSVEEEENLLTSPKTHFQPIGHDSLDTETSEDAEVMSLVIKAFESPKESKKGSSEINPCMSKGFDNMDNKIVLSDSENFKNYAQDSEFSFDTNNQAPKSPVEVKPIRAVSSSFEELVALTGHFTFDDQEIVCKSSQEKCEPFRFVPLYTWRTNQCKDKGTNTESFASQSYDNHSDVDNSDDFDFQSFMPLKSDAWSLSPKNKILGAENKHFEWKWSTNDDEHSPWNTVDPSDTWNENIMEAHGIGNERTKANGFKCGNLTALRKEIKDEEDELFRDISYLSDKKSCSLDCSLKGHKEFAFHNRINICDSLSADLGVKIPSIKHLFSKRESEWDILASHFNNLEEADSFSSDLYDSRFSVGDYDLDEGIATLPQVPADKILYSTDLENEWRKSSQPFDIQVPRRSRIKYKSPPRRRPCSFYLEGNCRRSDCRFSHDLSTITCRFWEEASCFKGITCPFLHGYPSENNSYCEESGISDCNYTLESEADFPSLSKVNNLDQEPTQSLRTSAISKPIRAKRKRNKSHSAGSSENKSTFLAWSHGEIVHDLSDEA